MKNNKATGEGEIVTEAIKPAMKEMIPALNILFNKCLEDGNGYSPTL